MKFLASRVAALAGCAAALVLAGCATPAASGHPTGNVTGLTSNPPASSGTPRQQAEAARGPGSARVVTLTETPGEVTGTAPTQTATVTDPAKVAALAAYLNGLPVNGPGGVYGCPADFGGRLTLTFRARAGGPVLAQASAGLSGCAFLSFAMPGKSSREIGGADAGGGLLAEVNRVAGLHWKAAAT